MDLDPVERRRLVLHALVLDALVLDALVVHALVLRGLELTLSGHRKPRSGVAAHLSAGVRTGLLAAGLGALALVLSWRSLDRTESMFVHPVLFLAIAVAFFACEQYLVNVEFRRQSHSFTLSGIPLIVGIFELPVYELVLARFVGSLVALLVQRIAPAKVGYNIATWVFEAALCGTFADLIVRPGVPVPSTTLLAVLLIVAATDQILSCVTMAVISIHGATVSRRDLRTVLLTALQISVLASVFASALVLLLNSGMLGTVLAVLLIAIAIGLYGQYAAASRRHDSLSTVHDFVAANGLPTGSGGDLIGQAAAQLRRILRASRVELLVVETMPSGAVALRERAVRVVRVDEDDVVSTWIGEQPVDSLRAEVLTDGHGCLVPAGTKDSRLRRWLTEQQVSDAIVVPLQEKGLPFGVLTVSDRLGDRSTFTTADLDLCTTLATHLSVALHNARLVDRLGYDATHDPLTGLANRVLLAQRLAQHGGADDADLAILLLDLDKFKEVNDVLGHSVGDDLLVVIGRRLGDCVGGDGLVARLGGDEFAVLLTGPRASLCAATDLAGAIRDTLNRPVQFAEGVLSPEASIGLATLHHDAPRELRNDLMRRADTAMYAAKSSGAGIECYRPEMDQGRAEQLALASDLKSALANDRMQFVVHYQPKVDLRTDDVVGCEALVRWLHPTLGVIGPDRFVPLAEATGQIERLTAHVLQTAMRDCATWHATGHTASVAVNISARSMTTDTLETLVCEALRETAMSADRLILEVTETSVMQNPGTAAQLLARLSQMGTCISLDDFGTGYSSLAYLQRLPVGELKIDRSFVTDLDTSGTQSRALVDTVIALGRSIGLRVVAEGIENGAVRTLLVDAGCHVGQGFHISRPLPVVDLLRWLDARRRVTLTLVS